MEVVFPNCAGLDVHKVTIQACAHWRDEQGRKQQETKGFGTFTSDLRALSAWLAQHGVTHVVMESTGVFWKPVFNILEERFEVLLVNAQHVKQVPGRKTDVKDCEWLADLLEHGLLRGSFIPSRAQRDLRDLTRERKQLEGEHTRVANRIHKVLEDANIKLGSVATDILGVSGRAMIQQIIDGVTDPNTLAEEARGRLREKMKELTQALEGKVTENHRWMLAFYCDQLQYVEECMAKLSERIAEFMRPWAEPQERLVEIPGVKQTVVEAVLAEIGTDMSPFPTADHGASWAGLSPGNNESAGKRKSGRTRKGNRWLRAILCQAAWAASHTKDTYFSAFYKRLARRRGKKRAIVALARKIFTTIYTLLKTGERYVELGADFLEKRNAKQRAKGLVEQLENLGYDVTVQAQPAGA